MRSASETATRALIVLLTSRAGLRDNLSVIPRFIKTRHLNVKLLRFSPSLFIRDSHLEAAILHHFRVLLIRLFSCCTAPRASARVEMLDYGGGYGHISLADGCPFAISSVYYSLHSSCN